MAERPTAKRAARRFVGRAGEVAGEVADAIVDASESLPGRRRRSLPNLYDVHPEARVVPTRELGLFPIRVADIVGTAVQGVAQRGTDFQPLPAFRSANWRGRWQRIKAALERLEALPPIDVLKTTDGYWVTDGHNRVAAALATGQEEIDAVVRSVVLPGQPVVRPPGSLAAVLNESDQVRAAGRGRPGRAKPASDEPDRPA